MISIIVPTYNRASLLPRCLSSVLRQTCQDFEIVVADDGSDDDTAEVVRNFAREDPRVRYVHQDHMGAGDARSAGVAAAAGKYVTFIDSDDEVLPGWLEAFGAEFDRRDADVVCSGQIAVNDQGQTERVLLPREHDGAPLLEWGLFLSGTFSMRKDVFEAVGGYASGLPANQHSEFKFRLLPACERRGWTVACVQEAFVKLHQHTGPKIRNNFQAVYESGLYVLHRHQRLLRQTPHAFANWTIACGGCAAKLRKFREARDLFLQALWVDPRNMRNFARILLVSCPGIRSFFWKQTRS